MPFPEPAAIAAMDFDGIGLTQRGIDTLRAVGELFDGRADELAPGADRDALRQEILAANYVAMRILGDPDIYLGGDLIARRSAESLGLTPAQIESVSPWRSYLTHHLWAASASAKPTNKSKHTTAKEDQK